MPNDKLPKRYYYYFLSLQTNVSLQELQTIARKIFFLWQSGGYMGFAVWRLNRLQNSQLSHCRDSYKLDSGVGADLQLSTVQCTQLMIYAHIRDASYRFGGRSHLYAIPVDLRRDDDMQ